MNPLVIPAAISGAASLFGGERVNAVNQREARINRAFQAGEAATNRSFQERMRNTEWQAAVSDMEAAGINPALAYSRGGASSPGGSVGAGSMPAGAVDSVGSGVSSAMQAMTFRKNLELLDSQIHKSKADALQSWDQQRMTRTDADMAEHRWRYYFDFDGTPKGPLKDLLDSMHAGNLASSSRQVADAQYAQFSIAEQKAISDLFTQAGSGGKVFQMLLPLLMNMTQNAGRRAR